MSRHLTSQRVFTTKRESGKEIPISFSRTSAGRKTFRGFTLIEVTVVIFVIGVIIVASAMLLRAAQVNRVTRDEDIALKVVSTEVETLRAGGYAALPPTGPFASPGLSALASGTGTVTVSDYGPKTKKVVVAVSWIGPSDIARTIDLTTLITETGGL